MWLPATTGHALDRLAVLFVFPTFMGAIKALRSVILFRRGSVADKEVGARWGHGGGVCLPAGIASSPGRQLSASCSHSTQLPLDSPPIRAACPRPGLPPPTHPACAEVQQVD